MKTFAESYNVRPLYGRRFMLDVLLDSYEEYLGRKPDSVPQIAIVDLKGLPTQKEFELFKEFFEREGYPTVICSPEELEFENNRLRAADFQIDIVYKRLLVNEYLPIMRGLSGASGCLSRRRDLHGQQFSFEVDSQKGTVCRVD